MITALEIPINGTTHLTEKKTKEKKKKIKTFPQHSVAAIQETCGVFQKLLWDFHEY